MNDNTRVYRVEKSITIKVHFYNLVLMYQLDYPALLTIAENARVPVKVVEAMYVGHNVHCKHAKQVLAAFSSHVHGAWNLKTVSVKCSYLLTLRDICTIHDISLDRLTDLASVPYDLLDMIYEDEQVSRLDAKAILNALQNLTSLDYTQIWNMRIVEEVDTNG